MSESKIDISLNINSNDYERKVKSAAKETDKLASEIKDIAKESKKTERELKDLSKATEKLGDSTKAGRLGIEALKDNLGALPVVGQTLSRALDDVEGSFLSVAKAAAPVAGIAVGVAAIGTAAVLAYKNSEELRNSMSRLGNSINELSTTIPVFESMGDGIAFFVNITADAIDNINLLRGATAKLNEKAREETNQTFEELKEGIDDQITLATKLGKTEEEIQNIRKVGYSEVTKVGIEKQREYENKIKESYNKIKTWEEDLVKIQEHKASIDKQYGGGNRFDKKINQLQKLIDKENEEIQKNKDYLNSLKEKTDIAAKSYKDLESGAKRVSTVRINERDRLKELKEQLKVLRNEQNILNDTVLDGTEAEEKKKRDLQAQLPLLESIYILEEQRGISNNKRLEEIKNIKAFLNEEETEVERLKKAYDDLVDTQNIRDALVDNSKASELKKKEIQDTQQQISALENLYEAQVKAGVPAENTLDTIKQLKKYLEELTKKTTDWKDSLQAVLSITSSVGNIIGTAMTAVLDFSQIDLAPFDRAIEEAQARLDEFYKWKEELEEADEENTLSDYEERLSRLDEEIEYAKKAGDTMSQIALENKKKEIEDLMNEESKKIEQEKIISEEEKRLQQELAMAEYNKEYANWQNQVKSAQTQKAKAIADSIIMPAQAIGNAAVGVSQSFAQGGLVGLSLGLAGATSVISSSVSGAAGVKNASSALDSIQGSPPQPPQFKFGTTDYQVPYDSGFIVGETGPEYLKMKGGHIEVTSNAQSKAQGLLDNNGIVIQQVIFNVNKILNEEEIYQAMNNYKKRNSFMFTR